MAKTSLDYFDMTVGLARPKTVVCVTDQCCCDRIIRAGRQLADISDTELSVINIASPTRAQDPQSIEYLFSVSRQNGAEMNVLYEANVARAIIRYIKENKVAYLLTGIPGEGDTIVSRIWSKFTHVTFFVVETNGELREIFHPARAAREFCAAHA